MKKYLIAFVLAFTLTGCGGKDCVTDLRLDERSMTLETDDFDSIVATVKINGNASQEITVTSSDDSIATATTDGGAEDGETIIDIESFEKTGEATITITTVGNDKNGSPMTETVTVTVNEEE